MTIKDFEVEKKANELVNKFMEVEGADYDCEYIHRSMAEKCAIIAINEVLYNLESIPKLTVCEFEEKKCYGIIDFYNEVKTKLCGV